MPLPRLILVGGFLGAGKTTLLARAALRLSERGSRVGLVANDQAAELVDSEVLALCGASVEEVAGGCFCCRFPDMIAALDRLAQRDRADYLLGEPVGSCTDLAATVMQPLARFHFEQFRLAPLSVLVDGNQVRVLARLRAEAQVAPPGRFPDNVLYIYEKQLEEADLIVLNKADRLSAGDLAELTASLAARFPTKPILAISALTGQGVGAWLEHVLQEGPLGRHIAEVDYDTYAAGEAALGWLNAAVALHAHGPFDWREFAEDLLEDIRRRLAAIRAEIAHLKLIIRAAGASVIGNVTASELPAFVQGRVDTAVYDTAMRINARVRTEPEQLHAIIEAALDDASSPALGVTITALRSLSPGRPVPTYRFAAN